MKTAEKKSNVKTVVREVKKLRANKGRKVRDHHHCCHCHCGCRCW